MSDQLREMMEIARILGVDLSEEPAVQDAVAEQYADYVGTGLREVRK